MFPRKVAENDQRVVYVSGIEKILCTFITRKHSSRMRTSRFCSSAGTPNTLPPDTKPPRYPALPEGTWDHRYPTPQKEPGTSDTLPPCEQTHACENVTFLQLRWRAVINMLLSVLGLGIDELT